MGLSKNITLTIKDYEIKLDKEIKFYENDTIDLCFSILEYGIEVKDGISINKLMPIQALRSYMLIETPHGIDYAESTKIEDNKIVFNLGTKYSQFVGIGRMQIVVKDSDGCRVTLPEFEFEIKESINMNWDRESFDFFATEDDSIIIDEFGRKIHMSKISDMPESENLSEESYAMIIDEEGNKRFKVRAIADAVEHSLDAKFNTYTDEINDDVEEFKDSVRTNVTTLTNENNTFKNQVNTSLANYGSDYNGFKDNVEARLGEHMTDYNRFKDGVETRIEESESTYDGFVSDVSTVLDSYGSTYNAFKSEVNTANASFRNTLNASNQAFKNEMVDRYDNFIYKIDEDIFEGGRTDYFGETHEKIGERLDLDFDVVHQRINDSGLMEYEGCSITANNTYYGRQKDTVIKGRTLQNIAKDNAYTTKDEVTTGSTVILSRVRTSTIKPNTVYSVCLFSKGEYDWKVSYFENGAGIGAPPSRLKTNTFVKFTTKDNPLSANSGFRIYLRGDVIPIPQGTEFKLIILEGDYTETPLEELPFIEGIESAGDKSKNLFYDVFEEGQINNETGEEIAYNGRCRSVQYANIEPNKTYTVSMVQNVVSAPWTSIRLYKDDTYIETVQDQHGNAKFTFESGEANRLRVTADIPYNDVINCQIEEGTQDTPYEPYYDGYKISGKSVGKNLFDGITRNGYYSDGEFKVNSSNLANENPIEIKPNTYYTGSGDAPPRMSFYDKDMNFISYNPNSSTCLSPSNAKYMNIHAMNATYFQIEEGETVTPYEPYKESNYSYILNEPLRSLPNGVCDEIDLTTGVLTRRVEKVVLDGNADFIHIYGEQTDTHVACYVRDINPCNKLGENLICNNFTPKDINNNVNEEGVISWLDGCIYFRIAKSKLETPDKYGFAKWLQDNPTTVIYELATPTTEQLTQQQLKSFDTTTHIVSDNKLMPVVSTKIPTDLGAMVNTLSLRNRELEEVNEQQDELIDITMMATDEMYSMLEPLMEAVEPMGLLDCSKMAQMYVAMVRRGIKKIEDIPSRYQEEVREVLGIKIEEEEWGEDDGIK